MLDGDLHVLAVGTELATTGRAAVRGLADHAGTLLGRAQSDTVGTGSLARLAVLADEDAGVVAVGDTRSAPGTLAGHDNTVHVDLTGDVEAALLVVAGGELEDGLVEKTHEEGGVGESGTAASRLALGDGDGHGLAALDVDEDLGLVGVDPHALGVPAEDGNVLVAVVGESGLVLSVAADPHVVAGSLCVKTGVALDTELGPRGEILEGGGNAATGGRLGSRRRSGSGGSLGGGGWLSSSGLGGGSGLCGGNIDDGLGLRGSLGSRLGGSRGGRSSRRLVAAVVDLGPVYILEGLVPVDGLVLALGLTFGVSAVHGTKMWGWWYIQITLGVELGVAVVQVAGGDGSSGGQGAQHGRGGEMHFEGWVMAVYE